MVLFLTALLSHKYLLDLSILKGGKLEEYLQGLKSLDL